MVFELCKYVFFVVVVFVFLINYSLAAIFNHGYFSVGQWNTNDLGVEKKCNDRQNLVSYEITQN